MKPTISVLMLAWQHGEYIGQAIESVLAQQLDEGFELLIGEDNSTDSTLAVCQQYQARHPEVIRVLSGDSNLGMHSNFSRLWSAAQGDLIAFCEGDDYWCDDAKLGRQRQFLRDNTDCTLCGTFTRKIHQDETGAWVTAGEVRPTLVKQKYSFGDLISGYHFHFSSVMLRKTAVTFPSWFSTVYCVDRPLYLLAAIHGDAGLIPEVTSVYRLHDGGNWSAIAITDRAKRSTDLFYKMRDYFPEQYQRQFERTLGSILWSYMAEGLHAGDRQQARPIFWQARRHTPAGDVLRSWHLWLKVFLRLYLPGMKTAQDGDRND